MVDSNKPVSRAALRGLSLREFISDMQTCQQQNPKASKQYMIVLHELAGQQETFTHYDTIGWE